MKLLPVVGPEMSWEAGWVAGFADGEGNLGAPPHGHASISQKLGKEADLAERLLRERGFQVGREERPGRQEGWKDQACLHVRGGWRESMRFLMTFRPGRLIEAAMASVEARSIYGREKQAVGLVAKEFLGPREVMAIETTTRTYIAEGLASHNCNFWRVLRGPETFPAFARMCEATEIGREVWKSAGRPRPGESDVERAWRFFVSARQSHAGTFKGFTSITRSRVRRGINGNASEWLGAVDGLAAAHARLRPVVVDGPTDALDLIAREDTTGTFFYLDPPYLHDTRATKDLYAVEADRLHHANLLVRLGGRDAADAMARAVGKDGCGVPDDWPGWWLAASPLKGKFLLSGYDSPMYAAAEHACGWRRVEFDMPNHQAGGDSKRRMTEVVWCNYDPPGFLALPSGS